MRPCSAPRATWKCTSRRPDTKCRLLPHYHQNRILIYVAGGGVPSQRVGQPVSPDQIESAGRDGGTGRRAGLKNRWPRGREGSSPSLGTTIEETSGRGGIGRRAWFRSMCPQGRGGSSPLDRTTLSHPSTTPSQHRAMLTRSSRTRTVAWSLILASASSAVVGYAWAQRPVDVAPNGAMVSVSGNAMRLRGLRVGHQATYYLTAAVIEGPGPIFFRVHSSKGLNIERLFSVRKGCGGDYPDPTEFPPQHGDVPFAGSDCGYTTGIVFAAPRPGTQSLTIHTFAANAAQPWKPVYEFKTAVLVWLGSVRP